MSKQPNDRLRLTDLPSEVTHAIAVHCDGDSALSLSKSCKHLRGICHSWLVFRAIVISKAYEVSPVYGAPLEGLDDRNYFRFSILTKLAGRSVDAWARYAAALSRTIELEDKLLAANTDTDEAFPYSLQPRQLSQYLSYMPQLLCLGYTPRKAVYVAIDSFREICRSTLGKQIFDWRWIAPTDIDWRYEDQDGSEKLVDAPALKFCFLVEIMRGDLGGEYARRELIDGMGAGRIFRNISLRRIMEKLTNSNDPYDIVACLSFNLRLSSGEPHPFFRPRHKPPPIHGFPLLYSEPEFCGPLRFAPFSRKGSWLLLPELSSGAIDPADSFPNHLLQAGSAEYMIPYLQTGEWCGYYRFGSSITDTLTPLHGMKLTVEPSKTPMHLVVEGSGMIGPNPCEIRGWINLAGGQNRFSMRLIRSNGAIGHPDYPISGQLTPFGLTGDMALDRISVAKIWLWNKAWHDQGET